MERNSQTRMLSVLVRQLERHRDLTCAWQEQRNAISAVVSRQSRQLQKMSDLNCALAAQHAQLEQAYNKKLEALRSGFDQQATRMHLEKCEVERRIAALALEEQKLDRQIAQYEAKNAAIRESFERLMAKLNTVKAAMAQLQAENHAIKTGSKNQYSPELTSALGQVDGLVHEKERLRQEERATTGRVLQLQDQLNKQKSDSLGFESFIRKLSTISQGYVLEPSALKEARQLLRKSARLRREAEDVDLGDVP